MTIEKHRRELLLHCYRMLGSLDDAEDAVQETMLRAWRRLSTFEERSTLRAWLYRIATNVCLDELEHRARRVLPVAIAEPADPAAPPAPDDPEVPWLQPFPDAVGAPDPLGDPAVAVERREHIALAFVAAVQYLPPRYRAVLLLRDVLDFSAAETAGMTGASVAAVNNTLLRARTRLAGRLPAGGPDTTPDLVRDELVGRYLRAWHARDVAGLVALMRADAQMSMPPTPSWYQGRDAIGVYLAQLLAGADLRLAPTSANRQPAFVVSAGDQPLALKVLTIHNGLVVALTGFAGDYTSAMPVSAS